MELPKRPAYYSSRATTLILLSLLFLFHSCSKPHELPLWMTGVWSSSFNGIDVRETWELKKDHLVGSTVWSWDGKQRREELKLSYQGDSLVYEILMEDKKLLYFTCKDCENDTLVFVNKKNDFPKRLVYVKPSGKSMSVWIDNEEKDPNRISFPFEKVATK